MNLIRNSITSDINILFGKDVIGAIWFDSKNWGDALSPVLIHSLSGLNPFQVTQYTIIPKNYSVYMAIGSLLDMQLLKNSRILKNMIIWGSGFIRHSGRLIRTPKQICSVRGPLTRDNILKSGLPCPEIYGDPALLYPKIYKPTVCQRYKLGLIPHFMDKKFIRTHELSSDPDIKIIDIENPINQVVDEICSCKYIASSSLHGIIAADAYNIPSIWLSISDTIGGDDFKFLDYFASVGRTDTKPLVLSEKTTIDTIMREFYHYSIDIDLKDMLEACPFYNGKHSIL